MKHINLIQMLQGCSKRNGMTVSASMHDDGQNCNVKQRAELMSEDEKWSENGALSSTCLRSASDALSFRSRYLRYAAMIFCVLAMSVANIGTAWADTATLTANTTSGSEGYTAGNDTKSWTKASIVTFNLKNVGAASNSRQLYGSSSTKEPAWQMSSDASSTPDDKYTEIKVASGYKITNISIRCAANGTTAGRGIAFCFAGDFSTDNNSVLDTVSFPLIANNNASSTAPNKSFNVPDGTRTVRLYKKARYDSTNKKMVSSGGNQIHSSAQNYNIASITVTYEAASSKKIYLKNTMGWGNAYVTFLGGAYWNDDKGSGNKGKSAPVTMSYDGSTGLFYADVPANYSSGYIAITKDNQNDYENFYNTEAIYCNNTFEANKVIVPTTQTGTVTKNGTKYYTTLENVSLAAGSGTGYFMSAEFNAWETKGNEFVVDEGTVLKYTKELSANSRYQFKINQKTNWWGNNGAVVTDISEWVFGTDKDNCVLYTGPAGVYTFTFNTSNSQVSISYPEVGHPSANYVYFVKPNDWSSVHIYNYTSDSYRMSDWAGSPTLTQSVSICGKKYYYCSASTSFSYIKWNDQNGHESEALSTTSCLGKFFDFSVSTTAWQAFSTYTISFAGNGKTSGTMSDLTSIAAGSSRTLTSNAFEKTGYTFSHWTADVDVKVSGSTIDVGESISDGVTIQDICGDIELTAQWSPILVTSITVSPSSKTLDVGGTQQLSVEVLPATALDKAVTWSTSNGSVATVSSTGLVTAEAPGSATITATAHDGSLVTGTCSITVNKITPTKFDFSVNKTVLCGEETATLTLEDSEDGVTYELREDSSHPIAETQKTGTGSALTWTGLGAGNYVVYAVETATYSERQMNGSKITISAGTATSITTQPTNQEVTVDEEATLTVVAAGTSLSYQWKESATEDGTYSNVASSGTSASYSVTPAAAGTKWYKCVVTGTCGTETTAARKIVANAVVTYTVTYEYNDATSGATPASATGSSVSLPNPTKEGYTLQGWYTSSGALAGAATATYNPTSNITLYALWREEACAGGGGGGTAATITIGNSASTSYAPTFTSSSTSDKITASATAFTYGSSITTNSSTYSSATAPYSIKYKPNANINTDEWSDNYSVSAQFSIASGYTFSPSSISATIVTEAASYTYQAILTDGVTTYTSSNVSSSANGKFTFSFPSLSGTALSGTVTFKVRFKSTANNMKFFVFNLPITISGTVAAAGGGGECYYVTYNGNGADGGFTTDEASHPSGSNVTVKTNSFTKTGYTFTGWKTEPSGGTSYAAGGTISSIADNMILYAQWIASGSTYDITYHCNDQEAHMTSRIIATMRQADARTMRRDRLPFRIR